MVACVANYLRVKQMILRKADYHRDKKASTFYTRYDCMCGRFLKEKQTIPGKSKLVLFIRDYDCMCGRSPKGEADYHMEKQIIRREKQIIRRKSKVVPSICDYDCMCGRLSKGIADYQRDKQMILGKSRLS